MPPSSPARTPYHGDVFEFFRNDIFNANKWENGLHKGRYSDNRCHCPLRKCAGICSVRPSADRSSRTSCSSSSTTKAAVLITLRPLARSTFSRRHEIGGNFSSLTGPAEYRSSSIIPARREPASPAHLANLVPAASRLPFAGNIIPDEHAGSDLCWPNDQCAVSQSRSLLIRRPVSARRRTSPASSTTRTRAISASTTTPLERPPVWSHVKGLPDGSLYAIR